MQDGAACHCTKANIAYIKKNFRSHVLSRKSSQEPYAGIEWPARCPDLNLLDNFIWSEMSEKVWGDNPPATRDQLVHRVQSSIDEIPREHIRKAAAKIKEYAARCLEANGGHFEK